jgi:hypothetical protein
MCTSKYDIGLQQIFDLKSSSTQSRSCTIGGCPYDVVVRFRPSESHYGKFGFDWLRVGDAEVDKKESDISYMENIGDHYNPKVENGKKVAGDICTKDSEITGGAAIFKKSSIKANAYANFFSTLPLKMLNPNTLAETSGEFVDISELSLLKKNFTYKIPVMTLMPNDVSKNPDGVNLEALLDVIVYMGEKKPKALKIEYSCKEIDSISDKSEKEKIKKSIDSAITFSFLNISKVSKKEYLKITSIGVLHFNVLVKILADNGQICGAFWILRNNNVRDVEVIYIGTNTNYINPAHPVQFPPPSIDTKGIRSKLAQALINIKTIYLTDESAQPMFVSYFNKIKRYVGKGLDGMNYETISLDDLDKNFLKQYKFNASKTKLLKQTTVLESWTFPTDLFRCYFFKDAAVTPYYGVEADGAGARGWQHSMFFGGEASVGSLSHELGHNLNLGHTFDPASNTYCFKYCSTDNMMDYRRLDIVFYYQQWKTMNPGGFDNVL